MRSTRTTGLVVISVIVVALAATFLVRISLPSRVGSLPASDYYDLRVAEFERSTERADVMMLGDSITDHGAWSSLLGRSGIANRGIGGDTVGGALARLPSSLSVEPRIVFVMLGFNDLKRGDTVDIVATGYERLIDRIRKTGPRVFVQSTLFASSSYEHLNPLISELNERLGTLARTKSGVEFIDLNPVLAPDGVLLAKFTTDGAHLNDDGYRVLAKRLRPYVDDTLGEPANETVKSLSLESVHETYFNIAFD